MNRLATSALVLSGVETVAGEGAPSYDLLIAEQATNIEITSETIEASLINPNYGSIHKIPTKKKTNINISLLPTGKGASGTLPDVDPFLQAAALVKMPAGSYWVVPLEDSTVNVSEIKQGAYIDTVAVTGTTNHKVILVSAGKLVLEVLDGSPYAISSGTVLHFSNTSTTVTTSTTEAAVDVGESIYKLTNTQADHKTVSVQFWYADLLHKTNGVKGSLTWQLTELPKLMFEGEGSYITPADSLTPPAVTTSTCDDSLMLDNLGVSIDGITLTNLACFESLEFKTNSDLTTPTIPSEDCQTSILTDVKPTFAIQFSQIELVNLPIYNIWENGKRFDTVIDYGDNTLGRNFMIGATGCSLDSAPSTNDVGGVLYTGLAINVAKPCGQPDYSNVVIVNY